MINEYQVPPQKKHESRAASTVTNSMRGGQMEPIVRSAKPGKNLVRRLDSI